MRWTFPGVGMLLVMCVAAPIGAADDAPLGRAKLNPVEYQPQRVVYDVAASGIEEFSRVLDRASFLKNIYHANPFDTSIVLVLHGDEIPLFAIESYDQHKELMTRARSLGLDGIIEYRMCGVAARQHGLEPEDIHGFVEIVPMADAEIVRLQQEEGHVYMR